MKPPIFSIYIHKYLLMIYLRYDNEYWLIQKKDDSIPLRFWRSVSIIRYSDDYIQIKINQEVFDYLFHLDNEDLKLMDSSDSIYSLFKQWKLYEKYGEFFI